MSNNETNYLFVDAGYLRRIIVDILEPIAGTDLEVKWLPLKYAFSAKRVFYYDCIDEIQKRVETDEEFQNRLSKQKEHINSIQEQDGYHVRLGTITGSKSKKRQKEVDVMLAVDMLMHSHNKNMTSAILLAGDLDFKPVVDSLIQLGTRITIACYKKNASSKLLYSADSRKYFSLSDFANIIHAKGKPEVFPTHVLSNQKNYKMLPIVDTGLYEGGEIIIYGRENEYIAFIPYSFNPEHGIDWKHNDIEKLKGFLEIDYPNIKWKQP